MGVMWVEVAKCAYDEQVESYLGLPLKSTPPFSSCHLLLYP